MELRRPRQWGACWLACEPYEQLRLDEFWAGRLPDSREGTCWQHILQTLVCYGLIDPGSEWRLHRQWFEQSAMGDLLDESTSAAKRGESAGGYLHRFATGISVQALLARVALARDSRGVASSDRPVFRNNDA